MLTNAIQAEVEAWNWSQRFVQAKFQPAKTENNISMSYVPAQLKFYKWPTHETDVKSSQCDKNSVISYIWCIVMAMYCVKSIHHISKKHEIYREKFEQRIKTQ